MPWLADRPGVEVSYLWPSITRTEIITLFLTPDERGSHTPLLLRTLKYCWQQYPKRRKKHVAYAPDLPLSATSHLATLGTTVNIALWEAVSITTLGHLFTDGKALSYEDLIEQFGLHRGQFLTHAAILANIHKLWGSSEFEPDQDNTLQVLFTWSHKHHRITNLYRAITGPTIPVLPKLRRD